MLANSNPTQCQQILEALKLGDRITQLDAYRRFGCTRLGARIYELKNAGISVKRELVRIGTKTVAEYSL